jgi:ribosomal protein S12 methylthiotransferase
VRNLYIVSLGCPKNLVDAETLVSKFIKKGFRIVLDEKDADCVLINTCSFLKSAIRESDEVIKYFVSLKKDNRIEKIFVSGCLVDRFGDDISLKYRDVDGFIGVGLCDEVSQVIDGEKRIVFGDKSKLKFLGRVLLTKPHSVYLKIADGCNNNCSYCTIGHIRGNFRSKTIDEVITEARQLSKNGAKEISLIAQDTTRYGYDLYRKKSLVELLKKLEKIKGIRWIRLCYLYPSEIDTELIKCIRDSEKIVHYLEMPIQHISDKILRLMNRRYTSKDIYSKIEMIKKYIPDVALRTSIIVGFPKENEDDFKKLLRFIKDVRFNYISFFKYSREKGTRAFYMDGVSRKVIDERYHKILELQSRVVDEMNKDMIGKVYEVMFDDEKSARSYMDMPDVDGRFFVSNYRAKAGEFKNVKVLKAEKYIRKGVVL